MRHDEAVERRIRTYLYDVAANLRGVSAGEREEILRSVEAHIHDALARRTDLAPTVDDVEAVLAEMDPPESYGGDAERDAPPAAAAGPPDANQSLPGWALGVFIAAIVLPLLLLAAGTVLCGASSETAGAVAAIAAVMGVALLATAFILGVLSRRSKAGKFVMIASIVVGVVGLALPGLAWYAQGQRVVEIEERPLEDGDAELRRVFRDGPHVSVGNLPGMQEPFTSAPASTRATQATQAAIRHPGGFFIAPNMRPVTLRAKAEGVFGLEPGDRVDVMGTLGAGGGDFKELWVLRNVKVLSTGSGGILAGNVFKTFRSVTVALDAASVPALVRAMGYVQPGSSLRIVRSDPDSPASGLGPDVLEFLESVTEPVTQPPPGP